MTKKGDPNPVVMLLCWTDEGSFQHLVKIFSAFGRHTFHPRPQDGVFRCDLNKGETLSKEKFRALCAPYSFTELQKALLAAMLKEKGFEIE